MIIETGPTRPALILSIVRSVLRTNGATVSMIGERTPTDGYMVAVEAREARVLFSPGWAIELDRWITDNAHLLQEPDYFIGVWRDGNDLVFDVSAHVKDKARAQTVGVMWDQIAIYDLANKRSIFLP